MLPREPWNQPRTSYLTGLWIGMDQQPCRLVVCSQEYNLYIILQLCAAVKPLCVRASQLVSEERLAERGFFDKGTGWCYNWYVMTSNLLLIAPTGFDFHMLQSVAEYFPGCQDADFCSETACSRQSARSPQVPQSALLSILDHQTARVGLRRP